MAQNQLKKWVADQVLWFKKRPDYEPSPHPETKYTGYLATVGDQPEMEWLLLYDDMWDQSGELVLVSKEPVGKCSFCGEETGHLIIEPRKPTSGGGWLQQLCKKSQCLYWLRYGIGS